MQQAGLLLPGLLLSSCRVVDRGGGCWYSAVGIPLGGGGIVVREQDGRSGEKKRKKKRYKK